MDRECFHRREIHFFLTQIKHYLNNNGTVKLFSETITNEILQVSADPQASQLH